MSAGARHQLPLGTREFQRPLQHRVLWAPNDAAAARGHSDCALCSCTCLTNLTTFSSVPTVCRGAGPFLRSAPWQRHLCPGTWVHLASAGLRHRGPRRLGLAASPVAHWSRTPGPYPACGRGAPPAPQGPSSTLPPGTARLGFPSGSGWLTAPLRGPRSAARPSPAVEGRHHPAQTSF